MQRNETEKNKKKDGLHKYVEKAGKLLNSLFKKGVRKQSTVKELPSFQYFEKLPEDIIAYGVPGFLGAQDTLNLAKANKNMLRLFKLRLFTLEAKLAHYTVVEPNDIEVRKILNEHPELLQKKIANVTDKSGRTIINCTPLQLAYYAFDGKMCETLKPYFANRYGSSEDAIVAMHEEIQEKAQVEDKEKSQERLKQIKELLATVINEITNERFDQGKDPHTKKLILSGATLKAIQAFREAFDAMQPKVIDKGEHFPLEILQAVYEEYYNVASDVRWNYNKKKCALFEDGVLAHVLTHVPANFAQEFNQGLYYRQNKNEEFNRSSVARDGCHFYHYLRRESVDFAALAGSCFDIVFGCGTANTAVRVDACRSRFTKFMTSKKSNLAECMQQQGPSKENNAPAHNLSNF